MKTFLAALLMISSAPCWAQAPQSTVRSRKAIEQNQKALSSALAEKAMQLGDPIFLRIFKQSNELEVWVKS